MVMAIVNHIAQRRQCLSGYYQEKELIPSNICQRFKCSYEDEVTVLGGISMSPVPAFACKFNPNGLHGNLLAVVDEEGSVRLIDSRKTLSHSLLKEWRAHNNAIFDVSWITDHSLITASGDANLALWDVTRLTPIGTFKGHVSTIRCVDVKRGSEAVFVSAGRDGNILLWDTRCYTKDSTHKPVNVINMAHCKTKQCIKSPLIKRKRKSLTNVTNNTGGNGITAVLFYRENMIGSSGAADGTVKIWDTRRSYSSGRHLPLFAFRSKQTSKRVFGFTSLITDCYHSNLFAGCMDDMIYVFDGITMKNDPVNGFSGHESSFYVKMDLSPCGRFLASGSSCGNVFIWDTCYPLATPTLLTGHVKEVMSVAWAPQQFDKIVTCSDACDVRIWRCGASSDRYIGDAINYNGTGHVKWSNERKLCNVLKSVENIQKHELKITTTTTNNNMLLAKGTKRKYEETIIKPTNQPVSILDRYWKPFRKTNN